MRCAVALTLLGLAFAVLPSTAAPAKQKHPHSKAAKVSSSSVRASKSSVSKTHPRSRRSRATRHVALAPSYQLHPDPERYQQIQQALASRGYFKGQVNGVWGDDSIDAMRRFQTDKKISDNEGKINALSLNALGLGAKHDGSYLSPSAVAGAIPAPEPPPPPTEQTTSETPPDTPDPDTAK